MKKKILFIINLFLLVSLFSFNLNVKADGSPNVRPAVNVKVTLHFEGSTQDDVVVTSEKKYYYGKRLSVDTSTLPDDYVFANWLVNGNYVGNLPIDYEFMITDNMELKALFTPTGTDANKKFLVLFVDSNGKVLSEQYVVDGDSPVAPTTLPTKPGYIADGWSNTNGLHMDVSTIIENTVYILQYKKDTTNKFHLTVEGGTGANEYNYNAISTVVANQPEEGKYFNYWKDENDVIVSYESTYSFTMLQDKKLTAVFSDTSQVQRPLVTMSNDLVLKDGYRSYLNQFYLPEVYNLVEFGLITSEESIDNINLDTPNINKRQGTKYVGETKEWVMSLTSLSHNSVRAYLIFEDSSGELQTFYSRNIKYNKELLELGVVSNISFNNSIATWDSLEGASSYIVEVYDYTGTARITTIPVNNNIYNLASSSMLVNNYYKLLINGVPANGYKESTQIPVKKDFSVGAKHVIINQVYLNGGSAGATYKYKFVELFNPTDSIVDISGWVLAYTAYNNSKIDGKLIFPIQTKIDPNSYLLIRMPGNGTSPVGADIPNYDFHTTSLNLSGNANGGKILLLTKEVYPTFSYDAHVVDMIGYGKANMFEGNSKVSGYSVNASLMRKDFFDTNDNSLDFIVETPLPRTSYDLKK